MSAIIGRFGPARVTVLAFASLVAGYAVFLRVGVSPDYPAVILPAVVLIGIAFGLGFSALSLAATAGIPDQEQGLAASLFQTSFQVGGAIVLAIVTAVVEAGGAGGITSAPSPLPSWCRSRATPRWTTAATPSAPEAQAQPQLAVPPGVRA
jgi:predicted MFS family arabinose efflux permease